ncbi:unnamed protein product [Allacma fusca]|uniref:ABC-type glutathione-S-conjugate transporter n=1 Tax=Allacma fusca TaxID=39272 RepID=A0A8J2LF15_9HEXA|nr:unnamed protein product [Allacma fusca]
MEDFCGTPFWDWNRTWNIPWSALNVTKLGVLTIIMLLQLGELAIAFSAENIGEAVYPVQKYTPITRIITFGLALFLILFTKIKGMRSSAVQFLFWFLITIFEIPGFRTSIRESESMEMLLFVIRMAYFPLLVGQLFLQCWADVPPQYRENVQLHEKPCPEEEASFLSRLTFFWFESLAWKGYRKPLEYDDLWDLNAEDKSKNQVPAFDKRWNKSLAKAKIVPDSKASFQAKSESIDIKSKGKKPGKPQASVLPTLCSAFGPTFLMGALLKLVHDVLVFVSPQVLNLLISFVQSGEESWKGFLYAGILFATSCVQTLFLSQYFHRMFLVGMRIRTTLVSAIYRKALLISNSARKESTVGEIVNLMSVDAQRFMDLTAYLNMIWSVKVLKLYAWEPSFADQVMKIRSKEIQVLKQAAYLNAGTSFIWTCAPFLVAVVSFASYVLAQPNNILDAQKAFVSLSLFNILRFPLSMLPMMISSVIQAGVSLKRLNKYMNADEIDPNSVSHDNHEPDPVVIENGSFSWEEDNVTLKNINLKVKEGSLVAIVGTVGSGKSSLLSAILGEMEKLTGRVNTRGSIAYVAQQAWIQNSTLRDNVLFGRPYEPAKYEKVINSCALRPDLEILPGGDRTEIGEKGINLSGVMKDGEISEIGTYKQLLEKKGEFADFLIQHINSDDQEESAIIEELEGVLGSREEIIARQRSRISESGDAGADLGLSRQLSTTSQESGEKSSTPLRKMSKVPDANAEKQPTVKDKLIEAEKAETGSVKASVYVHYLKAVGWSMTFLTMFLNLIFQGFSVGSNIWLSVWSNENTLNGTQNVDKRDLYLGVYAGLGVGQAVAALIGSFTLFYSSLNAASYLHESILNNVLRSPMSFFDTTPLGRILNRFAKDVDVVDNTLPTILRGWIHCFYGVIATLAVISYSTPEFVAVIIPTGIVYYLVQRFYVATSRQLKRLESVSRSPIYSHFGETLTGASTIRAYSMQDRFIHESESKVDHNQISYYPSIVSNRWLATLNWLVRMTSDVETNIVAVERIKEYGETPQEAEWEINERKPPKEWPQNGKEKRGRLTIIPQDPVLFSGTLRVNLDPFERYDDENIWRALELSHLKSFVKGLSAGLQHEVNEGGENLSVGQRQLVCLARALLRKTKILVLDEATAAVDLETDDLIQQTIRSEFKDCTVLTIAHRLNTIMDSTRVLVLDRGEIREFESPSNLLKNKQSIFYSMAKDAGLANINS